ncbi:hypothetical protein HDU96_002529, partial [Phlyctochytrium bullatum]
DGDVDFVALMEREDFFKDCEMIIEILRPVKIAIGKKYSRESRNIEFADMMQRSTASIADFQVSMIDIGARLRGLKVSGDRPQRALALTAFKQYVKDVYDKRWKEFDSPLYRLAQFLHPHYRARGIQPLSAQETMFKIAAQVAEQLDLAGRERLTRNLRQYAARGEPFTMEYDFQLDTPGKWQATVPTAAGVERDFSIMGWMKNKRRNRLEPKKNFIREFEYEDLSNGSEHVSKKRKEQRIADAEVVMDAVDELYHRDDSLELAISADEVVSAEEVSQLLDQVGNESLDGDEGMGVEPDFMLEDLLAEIDADAVAEGDKRIESAWETFTRSLAGDLGPVDDMYDLDDQQLWDQSAWDSLPPPPTLQSLVGSGRIL